MNNVNSLNSLILQNDQAIQWPEISNDNLIKYFERNSVLCTAKNSNAKISKSNGSDIYRTAYLAMIPGDLSGEVNVCPNHKYCLLDCIGHKSGRNTLDSTKLAKYMRTIYYNRFPELFFEQLLTDCVNFDRLCYHTGLKACIRLNAFSDIEYEKIFPELFAKCQGVIFYDYTKVYKRFNSFLPSNYHLTYSLVADVHKDLSVFNGFHRQFSAVVSRDIFDSIEWSYSEAWHEEYKYVTIDGKSVRLVNGDNDDLTFNHSTPSILLLREKYKIEPENDNPLVYRDKEVFGL